MTPNNRIRLFWLIPSIVVAFLLIFRGFNMYNEYRNASKVKTYNAFIKSQIGFLETRNSENQMGRINALAALGIAAKNSDEALQALLKVLQDTTEYPELRSEIAVTIGGIGKTSDDVIKGLINSTKDHQYNVVNNAIDSTGMLKATTSDVRNWLLRIAADIDNEYVTYNRAKAIEMLADIHFKTDETIRTLKKCMQDKDALIRFLSAEAINKIETGEGGDFFAVIKVHNMSKAWNTISQLIDYYLSTGKNGKLEELYDLLQVKVPDSNWKAFFQFYRIYRINDASPNSIELADRLKNILTTFPDAKFPVTGSVKLNMQYYENTLMAPFIHLMLGEMMGQMERMQDAMQEYAHILEKYNDLRYVFSDSPIPVVSCALIHLLEISPDGDGSDSSPRRKAASKILNDYPNMRFLLNGWRYGETYPEAYLALAKMEKKPELKTKYLYMILELYPNLYTGKASSDDISRYSGLAVQELKTVAKVNPELKNGIDSKINTYMRNLRVNPFFS